MIRSEVVSFTYLSPGMSMSTAKLCSTSVQKLRPIQDLLFCIYFSGV